jgi:hypothetical protein
MWMKVSEGELQSKDSQYFSYFLYPMASIK